MFWRQLFVIYGVSMLLAAATFFLVAGVNTVSLIIVLFMVAISMPIAVVSAVKGKQAAETVVARAAVTPDRHDFIRQRQLKVARIQTLMLPIMAPIWLGCFVLVDAPASWYIAMGAISLVGFVLAASYLARIARA